MRHPALDLTDTSNPAGRQTRAPLLWDNKLLTESSGRRPCFIWTNLTHDNEERFSLSGAAHEARVVAAGGGSRAGERKTCWTKPLPPSQLWALNAAGGPGQGSGGLAEVRNGALGET